MFCLPVLGAACTPLLALPANETSPILALDPETDPTVYTTQQGLEIKKSNGYISGSVTTTTNRGTNYTQDLSGFYYFTMGTFSGTIYTGKNTSEIFTVTNEPVNWLIIGRGEFDFYDDTPAGSDIQNDANDQEFALQGCYLPMSMSVIPQNEEIPKNSFLVLSEKLLGNECFNGLGTIGGVSTYFSNVYHLYTSGDNRGNRYRYISSNSNGNSWTTSNNPGGSLYNYINNLFSKNASTGAIEGNNNLGFTEAQADLIVPQQLYTFYSNGSSKFQETPSTDGGTYYSMFPLAYRSVYSSIYQNFCIDDYLTSNQKRVATFIGSSTQTHSYFSRSGSTRVEPSAFLPSGDFNDLFDPRTIVGVRPAMVMKLQ